MRKVLGAVLAAVVFLGALPAGATTPARPRPAPDFTLVDQDGHPFRLASRRGHPVVLFFGYTHCPDVCPTILANLKHARDVLGARARDTVVALVTVDPARDTAAALRAFVTAFDPAFVGLTGSAGALHAVYRAYDVRYAKEPGTPTDYLVSHTAFVYYIGRDGRLHGYGTWSDPSDTIEDDLRAIAAPPARR